MLGKSCGFTLFETLIVLLLISVLASFVWPLFDFGEASKESVLREKIIQVLQNAQQEAETLRLPIAVCLSAKTTACDGQTQNMLLFVSNAKDGIFKANQLLTVTALEPAGRLFFKTYPNYRRVLLFLALQNDNGTFWYCKPKAHTPAWAISLNAMGQIHVRYPSGVLKDSRGRVLRC